MPKVVIDMCDIFLFNHSVAEHPQPKRQGVFSRGAGRRPKRGPRIRRSTK